VKAGGAELKEEHTEPYTISSIASTSASLLFTARAGAGGLEVKSAAVAVAIVLYVVWRGLFRDRRDKQDEVCCSDDS
jgi:hypothetical protein